VGLASRKPRKIFIFVMSSSLQDIDGRCEMKKPVVLIAFNDEKLVGEPFLNMVRQHAEILLDTKKLGDMLFVGWGLFSGKEDDPDPMKRSFGEERFKGTEGLEFKDLALARGIRMGDDPRGYVELGLLRKMKEGSI
jgi:hypothetical protein